MRKVLGKQGAMDNTKKSKVNASVAAKQKELLNKLVQIHTYNDVGTIKHKSSLVSITKVIKDAKKKNVSIFSGVFIGNVSFLESITIFIPSPNLIYSYPNTMFLVFQENFIVFR